MRGLSLKLAAPLRRSGALPKFMPMMLATVKMITPESADALSKTRICNAFCEMSISPAFWIDSLGIALHKHALVQCKLAG